jgi:glutamine cyclotransferase
MAGRSSVRVSELATGKVLMKRPLNSTYFAEGLTKLGNKLYQVRGGGGGDVAGDGVAGAAARVHRQGRCCPAARHQPGPRACQQPRSLPGAPHPAAGLSSPASPPPRPRPAQLTWTTPVGFIYSANTSLTPVGNYRPPLKEGWGLTTDGRSLIASDGSSSLTYISPQTMRATKTVKVKDGANEVVFINELEWVEGEVWGNIWQTDCIARICPDTGKVRGWVLMQGLRDSLARRNLPQLYRMDVLNGIAYDAMSKRVFVTGKQWPRVFEVKLSQVPAAKAAANATLQQWRQSCISRGWKG